LQPVRQCFEKWLELGAQSDCHRLRKLCRGLLPMGSALWTFTRVPGAEPTNNRAERDLRHAVLWRRSSLGTQSHGGDRFVECMLTVVSSLRAQGRDLLDFLYHSLLCIPSGSSSTASRFLVIPFVFSGTLLRNCRRTLSIFGRCRDEL